MMIQVLKTQELGNSGPPLRKLSSKIDITRKTLTIKLLQLSPSRSEVLTASVKTKNSSTPALQTNF